MMAGLLKLLGLFFIFERISGGGKAKGGASLAPGVAPSAAAPAAAANNLPPFPEGWEYDVPQSPEVQARAAALATQLWSGGEGTHVQEMTGGRWITYEAQTIPTPATGTTPAGTHKGVTAWRVKGSGAALPAAPNAGPPVLPPTVVKVGPQVPVTTPVAPGAVKPVLTDVTPADAASPPVPPTQATPAARAATAMGVALAASGYRLKDQPIYKAFQRYGMGNANPDGFPGPKTMTALKTALDALGVSMPPVPIYPWLASGAYDGVNAPTVAQWNS